MSTVQDIEAAIRNLPRGDLAALRQWFAEFDAENWDRQIETDVAAGQLESLADEAAGVCQEKSRAATHFWIRVHLAECNPLLELQTVHSSYACFCCQCIALCFGKLNVDNPDETVEHAWLYFSPDNDVSLEHALVSPPKCCSWVVNPEAQPPLRVAKWLTRKMTTTEARAVLSSSAAELGDLALAVFILVEDPSTSLRDLMLALPHGGGLARNAAKELYRRTGEPLPTKLRDMRLAPEAWAERISELERQMPA